MLGLSSRSSPCRSCALFFFLEAERVPFGSFHQAPLVAV